VNVIVVATTSLMAAALSVLRSCFAVVVLYGLCYIGIKVKRPFFMLIAISSVSLILDAVIM